MSRNAESRFSLAPTNSNIGRSKFDRSHSVKFTFNAGACVPFFFDAVLPGDTFQIKTNKVIRLQTLLTPMMDNLYLDTYYFFVPHRLVWEHWRELMGENRTSAWIPTIEYSAPQVTAPEGGWQIGTIADYLGLPTGVEGISVSALPFRSIALIYDEWFRNQSVVDPFVIPMGDSTQSGSNGSDFKNDCANGGKPFVAAKFRDYYTSCLPSPQKGDAVEIPVAAAGALPVFTGSVHSMDTVPADMSALQMFWKNNGESYWNTPSSTSFVQRGNSGGGQNGTMQVGTDNHSLYSPANLWAYSDGNAQAATINQLRFAFQLQKFLERDARSGSRYTEIIRSHFGVVSPDARMQRPEYLGGNRIPININQVIQQSESGTTPQGTTAGMSLTTDSHGEFIKSFTEHGYVIGICVARYDHTYQQGIDREWTRKTRFDWYFPEFSAIGEQAVLNKEIYAQGTSADDEVFGYQEAWAEYRYKPNRVCGEMRSSAPQSLDVWHLADDYNSLPTLSAGWMQEDKNNVDRVLAVTSEISHQFFADFYIQNEVVRPMPLYSVPGLIDHF